ncbi:Ionotropic receptor 684 [Blattella germanica]|nr:Ionotropic receptor 684 [Blattella germanica]
MMEFHFSILLMVFTQCSAAVLLPEEETYVITCLKQISQLYFTTLSKFIIILPDMEETSTHRDRYLLNTNSPSNTTTDMAQSLLTEINGMNKLVFLIQPELLDLENITTWLEVPGPLYTNDVIIVFFTYKNLKTAVIKFMHSKAELLIILIVTSEYDDFRGPMLQKVLETFAKAQLFNVLILKPGFRVNKSKERVIKALYLYSWYSNYTIPNCGVKDNRVKVNTWLLDEGGKFVDKPELFPEIEPSGFKGCHIYVRKFVRSGRYVGFNVFMERMGYMFLNIAAKALGIKVQVRGPDDDHVIDVYMDILSLKSLTSFSNSRPTYNFREITLKWHVPCPVSVSRHGNFTRVFKYPTWLQLFLVAILFGLIIHWLYKNCKDLEIAVDFSSTLLKIWGILTGVSADIGTDHYKIRIAFFIWVLFCLIISTVFQAFFTGFLIDPGMHMPIANIKELNRTGITRAVPLEEYDFLLYSLTESGVLSLSNAECALDVCWYFYLSRKNFSFLADMLLMNPMSKGIGYKTCAIDDHAIRVYTTFYIPRNNYFFQIINEIVARITEAGIPVMVERSILRDMKTKFVSPSNVDEDESDNYFIFGMHHLKLIFYSLAIGYLVGLITFAFEKLHYKLYYQRVKQF